MPICDLHPGPCALHDSAMDAAIADSCARASSRSAADTFWSRSAADASFGRARNSSTTRAIFAQQMPTLSARSFF